MNRIPLTGGDPIQHAALNAIDTEIDNERRLLRRLIAANKPDPACRTALTIRKLELAAWQLGENLDYYLPAVYRDPRKARR